MNLNDLIEKAGLEKPREGTKRKRRSPDWYPNSSETAVDREGTSQSIEKNLTNSIPNEAPVASEVASQVQAPVASEVASQVQAPVASEVASLKTNNKLISKENSKLLSDSSNYLLIEKSWVSVLSEICKLCIENKSVVSEKVSYDFLAEKSHVNPESTRRIVRRLESESILIFKEEYFKKGHKGRNFEISIRAMLCMLTNDVGLRKWIARRGTSVSEVQKLYNIK